MKFKILPIVFLFNIVIQHNDVAAQIQKPGLPPSFNVKLKSTAVTIPETKLKKLHINKLLEEDQEFPTPLRYSVHEKVDIDIREAGYMTELQNGKIWRYRIDGANAKSLSVLFKEYRVPKGAELYIYSSEKKHVFGAFTEINNKPFKQFAIADYPSNEIILEYFEPYEAAFSGKLQVESFGKAYRDIYDVFAGRDENLAPSQVDINCPEGDDYQLEKHAVCKITFVDGNSGVACSGALINNTSLDGTPYFLTANHCLSEDSTAQTVIAYFNFEKEECGGTEIVASNKTISGALLRATRQTSDFTLLELSEIPDASYQPYYAGWDRRMDMGPPTSYSIHHASGGVKRISIELDSAIANPFPIPWEGGQISPAGTHWQVIFDVGLTEQGSSGSPLFNNDNKIIGQLHGGSHGVDYYGKLDVSWEALFSTRALKPWLDPLNTGVEKLEGFTPNGIKPDSHFSISLQNACTNAPVRLVDKSAFEPTNWDWTITPNTITFLQGTGENSQNPVISFNEPGEYSISLLTSNENGLNTQVFENIVTAGDGIQVTYLLSAQQSICFREFSDYQIKASGADTYHWEFVSGEGAQFLNVNDYEDVAIINLTGDAEADSSMYASLRLIGQHGQCADTAFIDLHLIYPFNDFIQDAYPIELGLNGPFSNECATIQQNEPIPPFGDCNSQNSWCDEYQDGTRIVENSLWFTFIAPSSGVVAIETDGFDNQIAIYEADVYQDIVSGNPLLYQIVAANDDYLDDDYSATITNAKVTPGEKYWIQMDGNQGGMEGEFTLELLDSALVSVAGKQLSTDVVVYPNPTNDIFIISTGNDFTEIDKTYVVTLTSLDGKTMYRQVVPASERRHEINVETLAKGIYSLHVYSENVYFTNKVIIE